MTRFLIPIALTLALTCFASWAMGEVPCDTCKRSLPAWKGSFQEAAPYARPSDTGRYVGYYVGGGAAGRRGEPAARDDGTWGWDYHGFGYLPHRVALMWSHGRRYQGGVGAYKTDGRPVPNVLVFPPPSEGH